MAKKPKKKLPKPLHAPLAAAIRLAVSLPLALGPTLAGDAASRAGRFYASLPFNRKRLARALDNLAIAMPSRPDHERREIALGSYQHLFRLGAEFAFTPRLINHDGWVNHLRLDHAAPAVRALVSDRPCILITGHVGNWELIGGTIGMLGFPMHAVYRPMDLEPFDRWMRDSRARMGLRLVSKFGAVHDLPDALRAGFPIGLVADQNGGDRGVFVPFFGRLTSTYKSIGLLALQFDATMVCGFARRGTPRPGTPAHAGLGYAVEVVDVFGPEDYRAQPDPLFYLTARYRRAMERMILMAPEQYLWMHRIWRSRPAHERMDKPFPDALKDKLASLPWMTPAGLDAVIDRSERDRRELAAAPAR
ncbi:MAG: lysophospholipid acyltransferase family protein [Phycisphaeraceae bacterium]|nr:MAG: lysophospholipid acyltransferase family protein [Phycisphaeraceae bacterium]